MQQLMLEYGIRLYPVLIPSAANELADLASRGELEKLRSAIQTWKASRGTPIRIPLPLHTRPGPLFIFKENYEDGTPIKDEDKWMHTSVDVLLK